MQWFVDLLKSRGKFGSVGLIVIGGYLMVEYFIGSTAGKPVDPELMPNALAWIMAGLATFGIRAKMG